MASYDESFPKAVYKSVELRYFDTCLISDVSMYALDFSFQLK